MAAVRITVRDDNGNIAPYAQLPVSFETKGPISVSGPQTSVLEGGMGGLYIRTAGSKGAAELTIHCEGLSDQTIRFEVR